MSGPPVNTLPAIAKPLIIELDGVWGELQTGSIINAGGTAGPTFTVGGKGLLFDDGTSTGGAGGGGTLTLQTAYNNSPTINGQAGIVLTLGKDFVIMDPHNDGNYFTVSAETGAVTINGDLTVMGTATTISTVVIQSDHQLITPANGTVTALSIQPTLGTIPLVDLVTVRRTFGSTPVFRIDSNGNLIATQNLTVGGLINGIDIVSLNNEVQEHIDGTGYQHEADDVLITPISGLPGATNVQEALEALETKITGGSNFGTVFGFEYTQTIPSSSWTVNHNGNTLRATITVYDTTNEQVIPEEVEIIDANNVLVTFGTPLAGIALVILF